MRRFGRIVLHMIFRYGFFPVWLAGLRIMSMFSRVNPLRVGKLTVYGPQSFLDVCQSSLQRLASLDVEIYHHLTGNEGVWVFPDNERSERIGPPWVISIDPASVSWREEGVIARLVYVVFYMLTFPRPAMSWEENDAALLEHRTVLTQTKSWLQTHGFPAPIVGCFSEESTR